MSNNLIPKQPLVQRQGELLPRFAEHYHRLKRLPRRVRRSLQRKWKQSLSGLALLLALGQVPALAATINVQGGCTLVDAITSANEDTAVGACTKGSGADTLVLPANSTQTLDTINTYTYDQGGATGLPEITSTITIEGNGATIERAANAPDFRIFSVFRGNLTLQQTTISGGELSNPDEDPYEAGGAIAVYYDRATLTLTDSTITGNRSEFGGGIFNYGGAIDITNSTISGNTGVATLLPEQPQLTAGVGGGIYNLYGAANIDNSTISGNSATYGGGFISLNLTAISGDTSKYAAGPVTLTNSIISDNTASKEGGGIFNVAGTTDLSESTVSGNAADTTGGGIYSGGYAGRYFEGETNALIKVTNSTISGNSAKQSGGGMYIDNQGGSAEVLNSTITGNSADKAGGVYVEADALGITLARALIAGNNAAAVREVFVGNDVPVTVANFNVFGYSGDAGIEGFSPGPTDLVPQAPLDAILDTNLANNGGPTQTHALPPGSPAVDAVTDGTCPPPDTDQRGVERPQDGNNDGAAICDIGAYELE